MNGRLFGLYAALQGGTRRKPTYLNTGALVSWLYGLKTKDSFNLTASVTELNLVDSTFETSSYDASNIAFSVVSMDLIEAVKQVNPATESHNIQASILELSFVDVVKVTPNYTFTVESHNLAINIVSLDLVDNVKSAQAELDSLSLAHSVTQMYLEDI